MPKPSPQLRDRVLLGALALVFLIALVLWQSGCVAVGESADGEAVIGLTVGLHPSADGVDKAANAAGTVIGTLTGNPVIGEGVKWAVGGIGALLLGTGGLAAKQSAARRSAEVRAAELTGAERGWIEREQAAGVQAPLVGGVVGGVGVVARNAAAIAHAGGKTPEVTP